ncbi:hypothetical protein, partial [Acinetobacter baumannii]|uniref:hypothetical protein n=1 Tax=Acinetobacter baumannii TaxID=470 RepID=UPI0021D4B2F7
MTNRVKRTPPKELRIEGKPATGEADPLIEEGGEEAKDAMNQADATDTLRGCSEFDLTVCRSSGGS